MSHEKILFVLDLLQFKKVFYGDARFVHIKQRIVSAKNGHPSVLEEKESLGLGVRALKNNGWGFGCTADLSTRGLERAVSRALETASASAKVRVFPTELSHEAPIQTSWKTPVRIDPWQVDPAEQVAYLLECEKRLRSAKGIILTDSRMEFVKKFQIFGSTQGSLIESLKSLAGGGLSCKAINGHELQKRSYPNPSYDYRCGGYEVISDLKLKEESFRIRDEALLLLKSRPCPEGKRDLILRDSILALQIHESLGHAAELDRVYGHEDNFGGRTFLKPTMLNRKKIGSRQVTLAANRPEDKSGAGFAAYDDEGVPARETRVVKEGLFTGYLSSRETAARSGLPRASGSMVAEDWSHFPLIRMTNLSLLPGNRPVEAIVSEVREGILLDTESSWSIDEERGDFQIGAEIAWHVKNGKIAGAYKNPLYRGNSTRFWKQCSEVADAANYRITGFPDCGKGGPMQQAFVSHGCSPALFRGVECYASGS